MTFKDIAIKNFKGNIKKYLIYYLCNSFIVTMFFMYSALIFNEKLWTTSQIEKGVLQMLIIPNVALAVFCIFFISYSHSSFIKWRKKEFGVFMNLGMTTEDIRKIIIYENIIVALGAILLGLLTGAVFSRLFFIVITRLLEVRGIAYTIGFKNFIFSISIFLGIYFVNLITTITTTYKFEIITLLKENRKVQNNSIGNPLLAVIGIGIVVCSSIFLYLEFMGRYQGQALLLSTILIPIGVYMIISQFGGILIKLCKKNKKAYYNRLILITYINSKFKETRKIIFILSMLVAVVIFYVGAMLSFCITAEKSAVDANTYDISYAEIKDKNVISDEKVKRLVVENNEKIKKHETLEFIYYYGTNKMPNLYILMTDKEINKLGKINLRVDKGKFISLCQFERKDETDKKNIEPLKLNFSLNSGTYELYEQEVVYKPLFKSSNYCYSNIIILNESDYNFIKDQKNICALGRFQLYNFSNWKTTKPIVEELKSELNIVNKNTKEIPSTLNKHENPLEVASKIGSYNYNKQGATLLLFTSGSLGLFFFIATAIVLFLKLLSDIDSDKKRFNSMYKIGISDEEIKQQIGSDLKPLFFIGPIIGIILAFTYTIIFSQDAASNVRKYPIYSNITVSLIFLFIQIVYYFVCKKIYCDEILEELFIQ